MANTSQDNFTTMKGHVENGTRVRMNNGDTLEIKAAHRTPWDILRNGEVIHSATGAFDVESFIVNY